MRESWIRACYATLACEVASRPRYRHSRFHDGDSTVAHAAVMTTSIGKESCATCHGPGSAFDPANVHTLDPR